MSNTDLTRVQEDLKPTVGQLMNDEQSYNPAEDNAYLEQGTFLLSRLSNAKKTIEDQRIAFTKPLNESLKSINQFFKTFSEPIETADRDLRNKLAAHRRELEYKRLEEQMRIEEENKKLIEESKASSSTIIPTLHTPLPELNKKIGGVVVKKVWTFKIKDVDQIPTQYMAVDEVKIRAAIRSGVREIAGVTIFQDDVVSL